MADELETLRKELWLGEIPTCFSLHSDDLSSIATKPEPCCLMLPRCSYLPLHLDDVKQYFSQYVKPLLLDNEVWCETASGDKIKWHLPVGVSYDMLQGLKDSCEVWHLTVHFSDFPEQVLLKCPSLDCVKANFLSTVKEADALKHSSAVMNNILESDNLMLWTGLQERNFDDFWSVNCRLMDCNSTNQMLGYKNVPVRIYKTDKTYSQPLVVVDTAKDDTVKDLLDICGISLNAKHVVISQGVEIPLESSIYQLAQTLSYMDNFLYICVVAR